MPKFMISASEEVFYLKEVEADNKKQAIDFFSLNISGNDIVDGRGFTIEEVKEIKKCSVESK